MSDNLSFELQVEIMNRLPVESLLRFRSISKAYKSMIDSPHFIKRYISRKQHLLVDYEDVDDDYKQKYVSIVDDHTFPQHKVSLTPPTLVMNLEDAIIIGYSQGLFCLCNEDVDSMHMAVIWNPSLRKAVGVMAPNMDVARYVMYGTELGFGVCRETADPKIVKIRYIRNMVNRDSISCIPWQVEVFALSTGAWRSPYGRILPRRSLKYDSGSQAVDGTLYWLVTDHAHEPSYINLIISFDITTEEFKEINLPNSLARGEKKLIISIIRNSVVVVDYGETLRDVWMMEDGVSKSFTRLFSIIKPDVLIFKVLAFRESGQPLMAYQHHMDGSLECLILAVYEHDTKHLKDLELYGWFAARAYNETLLLLDQQDGFIYGNMTPANES